MVLASANLYFAILVSARASDTCTDDATSLLQVQGGTGKNLKDVIQHRVATPLLHEGEQCWRSNQCGGQGGACPQYCGTQGVCCRAGVTYSAQEAADCGAQGHGIQGMHTCQLPPAPLLHHGEQCWHGNQCGGQGGACPQFCGTQGVCCRAGVSYSAQESADCGAQGHGIQGMHTCQLPPNTFVRGDADGSCPAGNVRVSADDCAATNGHSLSDGTALSNSHHRTDCDGHFTPGAGCFVNVHGNVYSTASECTAAQTQSAYWDSRHHAVCTAITELVRGGSDGSCPAGTSRVTPEDCPQMNGNSLSDGTALSNSHHRIDCAGHFVHGEGCFVNVHGNVYSTAPGCDAANAHGQPYWTNKHHAVCAR